MLQQIRKGLASTIVFALLALLIASFALWGAGGSFVNQGGVVATVGSQEITIPEYKNQFEAEVKRYREQFGPSFTYQEALSIGLNRSVIDQLVQRSALDEEAENLKLLGADEEVRSLIQTMPFFQDLTGKFSDFTYRQQLKSAGWSIKEFEDQVRIDIARTQLIEGITETSLVPAAMLDMLYTYRKEARRAEIATIPASAIGEIAAPDDATLEAFYELNKRDFMAPEFRNLSFLILTPTEFATSEDFSDGDLKAEYEARLADYSTPEKRAVEAAILKDKDQVEELNERVAAGEDFAAVAAELTGLERDEISQGDISYTEAFENYGEKAAHDIFDAAVGDTTEPIETLVSWQVFQVTGVTPGSTQSFEEVKDDLAQTLAEERGIDALYDAVGRADEDIGAGASLEDIAETVGVQPINIPAIADTGQLPDGSYYRDYRVYPYLQEAFTKYEDDELELPQGQGDTFYMIRVNDITPAAQRPFEEVKAQVLQMWRANETLKKLGERAREALAAAEQGEDLKTIATRYGGARFVTDSYVRDRVFTQKEIAPSIARLMFDLPLGGVGIEQDSKGDGYVVVKVIEVTSKAPETGDFEYQALVGRVSNEVKNDLYIQYLKKVRDSMDVNINQKIVDTLFDPAGQYTGASSPDQ